MPATARALARPRFADGARIALAALALLVLATLLVRADDRVIRIGDQEYGTLVPLDAVLRPGS